MTNIIRQQPIWLPTGNPDTTNIASADFNAQGGQPASLMQEFDYNDRVYQRVQLDSGATSATPVGVVAANQLAYWKDKSAGLVTNDRRFGIGGAATAGWANFVAGVFRSAVTAGYYTDIIKDGKAINILDGGNTFAVGEAVFAENDSAAAADRVAVGTAPGYQQSGVARGAASGGIVSVDVALADTPLGGWMAAATVTNQKQNNVAGNRRQIIAQSIVFASNGDTWATGLKQIDSISLTPTTNTAYGFTVSGGTITLVAAGGLTFRGLVTGY